jgi:hypothetical protein
MHTLRRTATVLIWPTIAWLGSACDRLDAPTAEIEASIIIGGGPGKATGGGQILVAGGRATFGFNAKRTEEATTVASGHLNYLNHVTGVHVNCKVTEAGITPATDDSPGTAHFHGTDCRPNNLAEPVMVDVVDDGEPGKTDEFTITYNGITDTGPIIHSGNIQVHQTK